MDPFGIRQSPLRAVGRFEMTGVSTNPEKPHVLLIHHIGFGNPVVMSAMVKFGNPTETDAIQALVDRGGITWENIPPEGEPLEPTAVNVAAYFAACIEAGHGKLVMDLWNYAYDAKNFGAATTAPAVVGEESRPS